MSGTLPTWLEQLLGIEAAGAGEGTAWSLDDSWSWAPWATLLFVVASGALVTYVYLREGDTLSRWVRGTLIGLRLGLIALVLFMIAEVVLRLERTGLPYVVVVIDDSGSMSITDRFESDGEQQQQRLERQVASVGLEGTSRINLAKSIVLENDAALLKRIAEQYKLKLYFLSESARPQDAPLDELTARIEQLEPAGTATRLGQGVRSLLNDLRGAPPAAVVILSDGITTDGETLADVATYARRRGVPLLTVGVGSEEPLRDVELSDLLVDEVVFVDDIVDFQFKLTASGLAGRTIHVTLGLRDGTEVLAELDVAAPPDGQPQTIHLPYRPSEVGEFEYEIRAEPLSEEVSAANNVVRRVVSVRKEQIRVLLVQSYPSYEFRYLKQMLERDPTIELDVVLQEADPEYAELDKTALRVLPLRRDDLFAYDVIFFGDVDPAFLSANVMQLLADFVQEKGGALVLLAGPRYMPLAYRGTPLEPLVPVDLRGASTPGDAALHESFRLEPTELGLASPAFQLGDSADESLRIWQGLPGLYWYFESPGVRPAARVLATHPSRIGSDGRKLPIVALQYAGAGKVLFHGTDDTWRWRYQVGDIFFSRYWVQTIRYLSRSKLLGKDRSAELSADRRQYRYGDAVRLRVRFLDERLAPAADDGVTVMVQQEGQRRSPLTLHRSAAARGVFEGVLPRPPVGTYHAALASPTLPGAAPSADFMVVAPPGELETVRLDVAGMRRAAEETGGHYYALTEASTLFDDLPRGRQVPIEALPPVTLWKKWPLLALFLVMIVGEWLLRKRKGLL